MKYAVLLFVCVFGFSTLAEAQVPPVKNPSGVSFTAADHAVATHYAVEIWTHIDGVLNHHTTLMFTKAQTTVLPNGDVSIMWNVQPIKFGTYITRVRLLVDGISSTYSPLSDPWERVPGAPSKPLIIGN